MNIKIRNVETLQDYTKVHGTHLVGVLNVKYKELVELLGDPMRAYDDTKTDVEWALEIETDCGKKVVATIYNWKDGHSYLGAEGKPVSKIRRWHVGGHDELTGEIVMRAIYK